MAHMHDEETFEEVGSGAAQSYPAQCSSLRKDGYILINDHPCKIVEMKTSKVGKHGHAKAHIVGLDVLTGAKHEANHPSSHNVMVPNVQRKEYPIIDFNEKDGYFSMLTDNGEEKADVKYDPNLCPNMKSMEAVAEMVTDSNKEGSDFTCMALVISSMGKEAVKEVRKVKN